MEAPKDGNVSSEVKAFVLHQNAKENASKVLLTGHSTGIGTFRCRPAGKLLSWMKALLSWLCSPKERIGNKLHAPLLEAGQDRFSG
jgi:hypothetical protein